MLQFGEKVDGLLAVFLSWEALPDAHTVPAVTWRCGNVRIVVFQLPSVDAACATHIGKIQCTGFRDGLEPIFDWLNYGRSAHIFLYPIIMERSFVKH